MAKKVTALIKLQVNAGKATPAPPIGPALGQHGVNIPGFCKEFNDRTAKQVGLVIPVVITVYQDRTFTFITKTPPAAVLIKKACGIEHASGRPNKDKVAQITKAQVKEIAELKMPDLNAASVEAARPLREPKNKMSDLDAKPPGPFRAAMFQLVPYILDAIRAYEEGVGSIEDIDKAMMLGCGYPMGPFALLDFVGLDTTYYITHVMYEEYQEKRFAAPPLLRKMVLAGRLGRNKTGSGFYDYD